MTRLHQKYIDDAKAGIEDLRTFDDAIPAGVVKVKYCTESGKLMTDACALDPRGDRSDEGWFKKGTEPTEPCDRHIVVAYDKQNGGLAHSASNPEHVVDVALIIVTDRDFPIQITIDDAQYVYRPMPGGVRPSDNYNQPYFINTVEADRYVGRSSTNHQYNTFSFVGFDYFAIDAGRISLVIGPKDEVLFVPKPEDTTAPEDTTQSQPGEDTSAPPDNN